MEPRLNVIALAVDDLERALAFYRDGLDLHSKGVVATDSADVDRILEQAAAAGASVTPPHDRPWGIYSGDFRDLDGHLWEII